MDLVGSLIALILVLVVLGLVMYLINTFIPMEPKIKQLLNTAVIIVIVVFLIFWLLGLVGYVQPIRISLPSR